MKKWLLIGLALVIVLSGVLMGCSCGKGNKPAANGNGAIQVPDGPKIKVNFNGPAELTVSWEKLEIVGFQLHLVGTLTNSCDQSVKFSEVAFILDGNQVGYLPGKTLAPGEQMPLAMGIVGYSENSKVLEVIIKDFQKIGGPTTPTNPTTPAPTTPQPTISEPTTEPELMPQEVVMLWLQLMQQGKFAEAEELYTPHGKKEIEQAGGLKEVWDHRPIKEIKIIEAECDGPYAQVYVTFYLTNGVVVSGRHFNFELVDGRWKINDLFGCYPGLD